MATPFQPSNTALVCLVDPFGVPYKVTGGGGSSVEIQVEGVDTADQTLANFVAGTNVTITNPSGGIIQIDATGGGGSGTVTQINTTAPLTGGPITTTGTIAIPKADATHDGYLSQGDWSTFNGKQAAGNYITALTGDVTASGPGSAAATLANIPNDTPMAGDLLATAIAAPSTPAAGKGRIYVDSTSKNVAVKDDAGVVKHGVQTKASVASNFLTAISDAGVVSAAQPAFSDISGQIVTSQITDANVTLAKIQNATANSKLLGSGAAGSGASYSELTLGTNLSMSGTTLNASGGGGATFFNPPGLRLTTVTGVPVPTTGALSGSGTLYYTPYLSGNIWYWDGAAWQVETIAEQSASVTGLTAGKIYDVFYLHGTGIVFSSAWTNDTTRADALGTQDGVTVLGSDHTKLWIGTIRVITITGTVNVVDYSGGVNTQEGGKRFCWNVFNQVRRPMVVIDTTDTWSYTTNTIRQANGASGNRVEYVTGDMSTVISAIINATVFVSGNSANAAKIGVGIDSSSSFSGQVTGGFNNSGGGTGTYTAMASGYEGSPGLGYHQILWNEKGADNTSSFVGDNGGSGEQSGMRATLMA